MDSLNLDEDLVATLKGMRDNVRQLFEQLRLRHEDGDIPGKDRLERIPALAKRNFANLTNGDPHLAVKEAWRLIDFLEGNEEARLSPRAREALRGIELDKQLAALRACERWEQAAARLREAVAGSVEGVQPPSAGEQRGAEAGNAPFSAPELPAESSPSPEATVLAPASFPKRRGRGLGISGGLAVLLGAGLLTATRWFDAPAFPKEACLALESASARALAEHWSGGLGAVLMRPAPSADARPHVFVISDPPGGPVRSTWTTSRYSYSEHTNQAGPGGGASDFRLRVGGWGDTYVSLLQVPIPTNGRVQKAVLRLKVLGDEPRSRPTSMVLRAVNQSWRVDPGAANHPWWRNCPLSHTLMRHLPPPGPPESVYDIDITDLYNLWARGLHVVNGIMLEPEHIGRWTPPGPSFGSFDTFYSTRASEPANRPQLILTY